MSLIVWLNDRELNQEELENHTTGSTEIETSYEGSMHACSSTCGRYPMSTSMLLLSLAPYSHSMSTFRDLTHVKTLSGDCMHKGDWVCLKDLPVIGDVEMKVADMRCIFREHNVSNELPRGEPEGKVWNIIQLEFCMNPEEVNRTRSWLRTARCVLSRSYWKMYCSLLFI